MSCFIKSARVSLPPISTQAVLHFNIADVWRGSAVLSMVLPSVYLLYCTTIIRTNEIAESAIPRFSLLALLTSLPGLHTCTWSRVSDYTCFWPRLLFVHDIFSHKQDASPQLCRIHRLSSPLLWDGILDARPHRRDLPPSLRRRPGDQANSQQGKP